MEDSIDPFLQVEAVSVRFRDRRGHQTWIEAVRSVGFTMDRRETVAIVGESGSGKSTLAYALTGLLPKPPLSEVSGSVHFEGAELVGASGRDLSAIRGSKIGYIFQEPSTALNPVLTVGAQLKEALNLHQPEVRNWREAATRILDEVGFAEPEEALRKFPFELSGGMQQRTVIALALSGKPHLLIADEPTTALDATIQAQIMDLLRRERAERAMAILLITHNFGLVKGFADRVLVMFEGRVVETGPTDEVLASPKHPYTQGLIACIPRMHQRRARLPELDRDAIREAVATEGSSNE